MLQSSMSNIMNFWKGYKRKQFMAMIMTTTTSPKIMDIQPASPMFFYTILEQLVDTNNTPSMSSYL